MSSALTPDPCLKNFFYNGTPPPTLALTLILSFIVTPYQPALTLARNLSLTLILVLVLTSAPLYVP